LGVRVTFHSSLPLLDFGNMGRKRVNAGKKRPDRRKREQKRLQGLEQHRRVNKNGSCGNRFLPCPLPLLP